MSLAWSNFYDPVVDPLVLAGSGLSLLATAAVLVAFAVYYEEQRMFRNALILNLIVAEFINSLNATLSGSYFLIVGEFRPGMLCSLNGWAGQVSVQASDFSMLAIAVFTLLTITEKVYMPAVSNCKKVLSCLAVWAIPFATGFIALGMGVMVPSGANWCWISPSRNDLRYGLTHGWRFAIILAIISIYSYVYYYTSRHFKSFASIPAPTTGVASHARKGSVQKTPYEMAQQQLLLQPPRPDIPHHLPPLTPLTPISTTSTISHHMRNSSWLRLSTQSDKEWPQPPRPTVARHRDSLLNRTVTAPPPYSELDCGGLTPQSLVQQPLAYPPLPFGTTTRIERVKSPEIKRIEREVKRMLMMNAYPIFYVLLWIPGLVNRLLEATGPPQHGPPGPDSPAPGRLGDALQAASAFIGFTSAVTYGFNRHLRRKIVTDVHDWKARRAAQASR